MRSDKKWYKVEICEAEVARFFRRKLLQLILNTEIKFVNH